IKIPLTAARGGQDAVTMNIGTFLNNVISFLIVAVAVFMLVKAINELRKRIEKPVEKAPAAPPPMEVYLKEIRDAWVKRWPRGGQPPHASVWGEIAGWVGGGLTPTLRAAAATEHAERRAIGVAQLYGAGGEGASVRLARLGQRGAHIEKGI